jgi:hypothetical protein
MLFLLAVLSAPLTTEAATIWTGPTLSFNNHSVSDVDQITPKVWLTRGGVQGIYNAVTETSFTHNFSPADTEWANGTTANYASLSYTDWNTWAAGANPGPPSTVGVNAVVHLISEDIYLDITFTSWPDGHSGNTGFSYIRSTPAVVNNPLTVTITNPASGAVFAAPANITIQASASDPVTGGSVTNVQFLVGSTVLTNETTAPFSAVTNNLPAGNYTLSAIASDNSGATFTNSLNISVVTPVPVVISSPSRPSSTNFQFSYTANIGLGYIVQWSTNLLSTDWITLGTNTAAASPVNFSDTNATASPGFYRVGRLPNP